MKWLLERLYLHWYDELYFFEWDERRVCGWSIITAGAEEDCWPAPTPPSPALLNQEEEDDRGMTKLDLSSISFGNVHKVFADRPEHAPLPPTSQRSRTVFYISPWTTSDGRNVCTHTPVVHNDSWRLFKCFTGREKTLLQTKKQTV